MSFKEENNKIAAGARVTTPPSSASPIERYSVQPQKGGQEESSPYYRSAAPKIEMPKGGGALKGIDEKFKVNAVNGSGSLEVAFPLTPGRGGFTPSLSLQYQTGNGNSEFGLGWAMSLPSIQRKTDKQLPRYNQSDVFLLAGAEDLVPELDTNGDPLIDASSGNYIVARYRPRIEGLFARIEKITRSSDSTDCWWRVITKDNIVTYYGLTTSGRISNPQHGEQIFKWLPQLVFDHKGNVQEYTYKAEDSVNVTAQLHEVNRLNNNQLFTQRYLKTVQYCNQFPQFPDGSNHYEPTLSSPGFLMECVLDYGEHDATTPAPSDSGNWLCRRDPFSDFHAGFELRTYRKCKRVLMFHRFAQLQASTGLNDILIRSLNLTYQYDASGGLVEADFLTAIQQVGYQYRTSNNTYLSKGLPALQLSYETLQWQTTMQNVSAADAVHAPQGLTGNYQWIDLWGEGLPGILHESGQPISGWQYKNNLGGGHFGQGLRVAEKPSFAGMGAELQWADLDADGNRQVTMMNGITSGYFELDDDQEWQPFRAFTKNLNIDWNSPFTKLLDLDGDGKADALVTEDRAWTWYHNEGKIGHSLGGYVAAGNTDEEKGPRLLLNDAVQSIFLADMNGDGMTDLVRIKNGEVCYWANMGYGKFGAKVSMSNAPIFGSPELFNPAYLTLADISGTGAADLIYLGNNNATAWINMGGNGFGTAQVIHPLPAIAPETKIAILDFLGNGTGCLVWSSALPQHAHAPMRYIDLMGGKKPYLLKSYNNGLGKTTELEYKSSTQFYLADKTAGTPWATRLPFPVHCLSKVTTSDAVSDTSYVQTYSYHHGYYDHAEREFRGFGRVDSYDTETATTNGSALDQPPVLTKTWYHTGAWLRNGTLTAAYAAEYYGFSNLPDLTPEMPTSISPVEVREAYRALKGTMLRQEIFSPDGSSVASRPYLITAAQYCVTQLQGLHGNKHAVFYAYQRQALSVHTERTANDPSIVQELTIAIDDYGNVTEAAKVAYARTNISNTLPDIVQEEQSKTLISYTVNGFTTALTDNIPGHYRTPLPCSSDNWELCNNLSSGFWTAIGLQTLYNNASDSDLNNDSAMTSSRKRRLSSSYILYLDNSTGSLLNFGSADTLGLEYQRYTLAYTTETLNALYYDSDNNAPLWDDNLLHEGGYLREDEISGLNSSNTDRWWLPSGTMHYDDPVNQFYSPVAYKTPFHYDTPDVGDVQVTYFADDHNTPYWLVPYTVAQVLTDIDKLLTTVESYDWRCLQPTRIKDPNDNITEVLYDALCLPVAMALKGKDDGTEGDELDGIDPDGEETVLYWNNPSNYTPADLVQHATWRCIYKLDASPARVLMTVREKHYQDKDDLGDCLQRMTYTDGFGRVAMEKTSCEELVVNGHHYTWVGSGKTVYNNKGKAVMQYEPYFSEGASYDHANQIQGVSPKLYYDPLGRNYKTVQADGTYTTTAWNAWEQTIYDANDNLTSSQWYADRLSGGVLAGDHFEVDAKDKTLHHANTPTTLYLDTLNRPIYTLQQNSTPDDTNTWTTATIESYVQLDLLGNRRAVLDGRGITNLTYLYNYLKAPCLTRSNDSGQTRQMSDVAGQPLSHWDAMSHIFHEKYDPLRRPLERWVDGRQYEHTVYGEGQTSDDKHFNLRGQVWQHYHNAGLHQTDQYDFKGLPIAGFTELLSDYTEDEMDWNNQPTSLNGESFHTDMQYDALGRVVKQTDPGNNRTEYGYDGGGLLKTVTLTPVGGSASDYVTNIRYNARGQRAAIYYGNESVTNYYYDEKNYRLRRLRTLCNSTTYQDLNYYYDPVGNVTAVRDDSWSASLGTQTVFFNNAVVKPEQDYTYDALYRLCIANGRESINDPNYSYDNYDDGTKFYLTHPSAGSAMQRYTQYYSYDEVGNMARLQHSASSGSYTRDYTYDDHSNRLIETRIGSTHYDYWGNDGDGYDARGNMLKMPHLNNMVYNSQNTLSYAKLTVGSTSDHYYQYAGGERIRKVWDKGGGLVEERIYLGNFEIYRKYDNGSIDVERSTVHIADDTGRIAMLEVRNTSYNSDGNEAVLTRYVYGNHLSSATLELDDSGAVISYEEYHPYGTTAYQAQNKTISALVKRYRFTGKERDEGTGLYYHGARYYLPWLCRWGASDPMQHDMPQWSSYNYGFDSPIKWTDSTGMQPDGKDDIAPIKPVATKQLDASVEKPEMQQRAVPKTNTKIANEAVVTPTKQHTQAHVAKPTVNQGFSSIQIHFGAVVDAIDDVPGLPLRAMPISSNITEKSTAKHNLIKLNNTVSNNNSNEKNNINNEVLDSPVENAPITSAFGIHRNVGSTPHIGTDYGVPTGTQVHATASGTVARAYWSATYGKTIIIDHGTAANRNEHIYTLYAHGSQLQVHEGQSVNVGDNIMLSGGTGSAATGPHLHYEINLTSASPKTKPFFQGGIRHRFAPNALQILLNQ